MTNIRVIITVGVSLLENAQKRYLLELLDEWERNGICFTREQSNQVRGLISGQTWNQNVEEAMKHLLETESTLACAETTSYMGLVRKGLVKEDQDRIEVILLATQGDGKETGSVVFANTLNEWMRQRNSSLQLVVDTFEGGVKTDAGFRCALIGLVEKLNEHLARGGAVEMTP